MGAWGVGMQANDTALDAISDEQRLRKIRKSNNGVELQKLLQEAKANNKWGWEWEVLGVVEYLLDDGMNLAAINQSRGIINEALASERTPEQLECWKSMLDRIAALNLFERRLNGEEVPQEEVEATNEGLLSKMCRIVQDRQGDKSI